MLHTSINKNIKSYRQITKLNRFCNCLVEGDIVDINGIAILFDESYPVVPSVLEFYDGKCVSTYTDIKIVKIVDDNSLNKTYDSDNSLLLYYDDDYVKNNYRNLIKSTQSFKSLVGKYIIDWKHNNKLINILNNINKEYIELQYCVHN